MTKILFDHSKLKGRAREKNETVQTLSAKLGVSPKSVTNKWNGKNCFTDVEIYALCAILDIRYDEVGAYFFAPTV